MKAAAALGEIPVDQVLAALEAESPVKDGELTLAAKVLLIRWAGSDGRAAAAWAWKRFRAEGLWPAAFQEIGPAWAWHDAKGLHRWAVAARREKAGGHTTIADAESSETPILRLEEIFKIAKWLAPEEPRLAFELRISEKTTTFGDDAVLPGLLRNTDQVKEALLAFDDLDQIKPGIIYGHQMLPLALLGRWKELDPENFARTPYANLVNEIYGQNINEGLESWRKVPAEERAATANNWIAGKKGHEEISRIWRLTREWAEQDPAAATDWVATLPETRREQSYQIIAGVRAAKDLNGTLDWGEELPTAVQVATMVEAFDGWSKAHPGQRPDMSGWSEERVTAWEDLQEGGVPIR